MSLAMFLLYYFLSFGLHPLSVFLKSLKNPKTLKITVFQRMDLPSFPGKKGGETPTLLDPVD
jgi:hypothetical protein